MCWLENRAGWLFIAARDRKEEQRPQHGVLFLKKVARFAGQFTQGESACEFSPAADTVGKLCSNSSAIWSYCR